MSNNSLRCDGEWTKRRIWIGEDGEALAREGVRRIVDAARRAISLADAS